MATTMSLETAGQELAAVVKEWDTDEVDVVAVEYDIAEDRDGVPSVYLSVVLSDPPAGADTWPLDDLLSLRRAVRAKANAMGLEAPFYLWFTPETDPPQDDT